ncbi:MAG: DolP-mannose mannosyltransferase [Chloroflexi bacterium]|nr:DolP-mannose mannosyltransferase [Chloroflexota bacterium]
MKSFWQELNSRKELFIPIFILGSAIALYSLYGQDGKFLGDDAIFMYGGQRLAEGVPPYVSVFDHRGPLGTIIAGLGVLLSKLLSRDDISTVRMVFMFSGALAVVGVYLLASQLFASPRAGVFASFSLLAINGFGRRAAFGPQPKTAMVAFEVFCLLFTVQKQWFWGGIFGALSFLIWQPMAIFPLLTLFLATQEPPSYRRSAVMRAVAGVGIPLVLVIAYYYSQGAQYEFWEGMFVFNLLYINRPLDSLLAHITKPINQIFVGYTQFFLPILIGLLVIGYFYFWRRSRHISLRNTLTKDRFASVLLSFPVILTWSLIDFQGKDDFYVFLPYVVVGFAYFLELVFIQIQDRGRNFLQIGVAVSLLGFALQQVISSEKGGLDVQRERALEIEARLGIESRLLSIGAPEVLVFLHRQNPTRYILIDDGIDRLIDATTPGGFDGWLVELETYDPQVVVFGHMRGEFRDRFLSWLNSSYREERLAGRWRLFTKAL